MGPVIKFLNTWLPNLEWFHYLGFGALVVIFAIIVGARISARLGKRYKLRLIEDFVATDADELVVIVPGYARGVESMDGVHKAVREVRPKANILSFDYNRHAFSNGNAFRIAERIDEEIDARHAKHPYKRIVLLGYSMGALLIRKAYVYGCGSVADAPTLGGVGGVSREPRDWVKNVARFVLLAGMNRGWNPEHRNTQTPSQRIGLGLGLLFARCTHTCLLVRQGMRGEPFVANLRLQWLEVMRNPITRGITPPRVIQLLGDRDDVVSEEDSRDVTVARDFIWVTVNNTGHRDMCHVGDSGPALDRKRKIQLAFGEEAQIDQLKRTRSVLTQNEDPAVKMVVFVLHGIRDMGEWTSEFEAPLRKAYLAKYPGGDKLYVHRASYGHFGMGPFLLFGDRQKNVRWFMDQVTELTARFPNLQDIHFIGHSNGTYVLASALDKYRTLKVKHVVLAGSVIRTDFHWDAFPGRVTQVRNYVGSKDCVVGLLPRLFELPFFGFLNRDIGSAGFNGFESGFVREMETQFIRGGHGAALVPENVPSIVDFVINGIKSDNSDIFVRSRPGWIKLASNTCWLIWLMGVAIIVLGAWKAPAVAFAAMHVMGWHPLETVWLDWGLRLGYVFILWLLLLTL